MRDNGESADVGGDAGESDDAAAVGQKKRVLVAAIAARADIELTQERAGFFNPFAGLAGGGRSHNDERTGVIPGVMERLDSRDGRLAPLTSATEHQAVGGSAEDIGLNGVGLPMEFVLRP